MWWRQIKCILFAAATAGTLVFSTDAQEEPPKVSRLGLVISYQRETAELIKRDLALKIIDSGILKLYEATTEDIAKIFGKDWAPDIKSDKDESYGIISFAKRLPEAPAGQVATTGWYMVVYYSTSTKKVFDWDLSNVHK